MAHKRAAVERVAARRYWRAADARVMVEAWQRSGESLSGFARRYRVHGKRISRWARQLAPAPRGPLTFHPARLVDGPGRGQPGRAAIEVVLPDGRSVRVPPGFAPDDLHQVLRVLTAEAAC